MDNMRIEGSTQSYDDWQDVIEACTDLPALLRYVNKTRRAAIPVGVNGHVYYVLRRDFKQLVSDLIDQEVV